MVRIRIIIGAIPVITVMAVTLTTMVITTSAVTSVTTTSRIALGLMCIFRQMPFSSGKKAVIFNRTDSWDFSSYREGDGNALPPFDKEKLASSSLLALAPLPLKYLGWHAGFNLERLLPKRRRRGWTPSPRCSP